MPYAGSPEQREAFSMRGRKQIVLDFLEGKINRDGFLWKADKWGLDNLKAMQVFQIKYEGRKVSPQELYDICK